MLQLSWDFLPPAKPRPQPVAARPPVRVKPPVSPDEPFPWKHGLSVKIIRQRRARRYLLRLQPDGIARLVIPNRGSRAEALAFLERSEAWLLQQLELGRGKKRAAWGEGTRFLFRGEDVVLHVEAVLEGVQLQFADQIVHLPVAQPDYRPGVMAHLRRLAERELPPRTWELAKVHGITISRVSIRAQTTRWGSCSARGTISLNWRLIQAPAFVIDYLIIHELMHRREMNHSARYWKLVAEACPGYETAEAWLKVNRLETTG